MNFKVMTFNVRGSRFDDGENIWQNRRHLNLRTIKKYAPDVIGFQEADAGNIAFYQEHLSDYEMHRGLIANHEDDERGQYMLIAFKSDRFERLERDAFYLSETPEVFSVSWDSSLSRAAQWMRLKDRQTSHEFIFLNTHLDHIGEQARVESAKLIVSRLARLSAGKFPVIAMADFNSRVKAFDDSLTQEEMPPAGTVHSVFMDAGYKDTFYEAGHDDAPQINTFHGFRGEAFYPIGLRIDWILLRDGLQTWITEACEVITDHEEGIYPSDHYPVMATLSLESSSG